MKYSIIEVIFSGLLLFGSASAYAGEAALAGALRGFGLSFSSSPVCALEKNYTRGDCSEGKKCFATITAACPSPSLRFEVVSGITEKEALKLVSSRFTRVKMLYSGYMAYPGMITSRDEVPDDLRPREVKSGPLGYDTLYMPASARMAYGVGSKDLVKYAAAMSYRYCSAAKTLVQVEMFFPAGTKDAEMTPWLQSASCH
jgi:hypothetical protein